jgi:hypothetical protein
VPLTDVTTDRNGSPRPQGRAYDVGAYERKDDSARIAWLPGEGGGRAAREKRRGSGIVAGSAAIARPAPPVPGARSAHGTRRAAGW